MSEEDKKILEEYVQEFNENKKKYKLAYSTGFGKFWSNFVKAIENLINRNKQLEEIEKEHKKENGKLRDRINKTINKLNEDISDDNCMWVNNEEKIVKTAKTIIDRSNYAKEILELLEERN